MTISQFINLASMIWISHFIADFVFQTRKMGENKSTSLFWLSMHILTYFTVFLTLGLFYLQPLLGWWHFIGYVIMNTLLHFATDFITSKITGYFYMKAESAKTQDIANEIKLSKARRAMKGFWTTIGFDQLVHCTTLIQTLKFYIPF